MTKKTPTKKKTTKKTAKKVAKKAAKAAPPRGRVIGAGEPPPWRVQNPAGEGCGVIICDHASLRVPKSLKDMGLKKSVLRRHIGWDIGAETASLYLSRALDMPAVLAQYSRLVVDLNRSPAHHECIPTVSDKVTIPANAHLSKAERTKRMNEIYWPYQRKIGQVVDRFTKKKQIPVLISVHSYTPAMDGKKRPWHIAILWNKEKEIAKRVIANIRRRHPGILVGENEPYTLIGDRFAGSTIDRHGEARDLPYIFVEFRQDLIDTPAKAQMWAHLFLEAIRPVLEDPAITTGRRVKPLKK